MPNEDPIGSKCPTTFNVCIRRLNRRWVLDPTSGKRSLSSADFQMQCRAYGVLARDEWVYAFRLQSSGERLIIKVDQRLNYCRLDLQTRQALCDTHGSSGPQRCGHSQRRREVQHKVASSCPQRQLDREEATISDRNSSMMLLYSTKSPALVPPSTSTTQPQAVCHNSSARPTICSAEGTAPSSAPGTFSSFCFPRRDTVTLGLCNCVILHGSLHAAEALIGADLGQVL